MIKIFVNLLFALFSSSCPLYEKFYVIIKALQEYSPDARAELQKKTKTSILCILLLQVRRFSQGKMVATHGCLGEFTNMVNQITVKNCKNISHIKVPTRPLH